MISRGLSWSSGLLGRRVRREQLDVRGGDARSVPPRGVRPLELRLLHAPSARLREEGVLQQLNRDLDGYEQYLRSWEASFEKREGRVENYRPRGTPS